MKTNFSNLETKRINKSRISNRISGKLLTMLFSISIFAILFSLNSCEDNSVKEEPVVYNYEGILSDKDNNPIPNATIDVYSNSNYTLNSETLISSSISYENGNYKIENIKNNMSSYKVKVTHSDFKNIEMPLLEFAKNITDGKIPSKLENDNNCCGLLNITIKDENNEPIDMAKVKFFRERKNTRISKSNELGVVNIENICEGTFGITIQKEGYKAKEEDIQIKDCNPVNISVTLISSLTPPPDTCCKGKVNFYVKDKNAVFYKNALVKLKQSGVVKVDGKTNENGYVGFEALCEGKYSVLVSLDGFKTLETEVELKCDETIEVTRVVEANNDCCEGNAEIVIKDKDGKKVPNALIKFKLNGVVKADGKTNSDGYIKLEDLCEGKYSVFVSVDGYKSTEFEFVVKCNLTTEASKVIEKNSTDCCNNFIDVTVKDKSSGDKIENATAYIYLNGNVIKELKTNKNGRIELGDRCKGNYKIKVMKVGYNTEYREFKLDCGQTETLVFELTK